MPLIHSAKFKAPKCEVPETTTGIKLLAILLRTVVNYVEDLGLADKTAQAKLEGWNQIL